VAGDPTLRRTPDGRKSGRQEGEGNAGPIGGNTEPLRAGLLGRSIQESLSPRMHEAEGARLGLQYTYQLFDFDRLGLPDVELPRLIAKLRADGFAGLNITHPFKERVVAHLDRLSPDAAAIGAVNTVIFGTPEGTVGHNTDCWGFAESFRRGLQAPRLEAVVLIGAGGAGMAVARALVDLGVRRLTIFDIDREKASRLAKMLGHAAEDATVAADIGAAIRSADGLVNATPVGMAKYPGMPIDPGTLRRDLWVADIVYFPAETDLLRDAKAAGCQTLPGAGMAIFQAVKAFELITGLAPDPGEMASHFLTEGEPPR
jgi:shikimate dehydrogenase